MTKNTHTYLVKLVHKVCNRCTLSWLTCVLGCSVIQAEEKGKFINPITDVCWKCIFPIHIAGANVTSQHHDYVSYKSSFCVCAGAPPKVGLPLAFWEPVALIDVTHTPYKSVALGGISFAQSDIRKRGSVSHVGDTERTSFYNVHYYKFPLLSWLGMLPGFSCIEGGSDIDISYLSELDPSWNDDSWTGILHPEAYLFANPLAQAACIADCTTSSLDAPTDKLFWCGGCLGSPYPYTGHVSHHVGAVQASYLLVQRLLAKLHSLGMIWGAEEENFCEKVSMPRLRKTIYKTQLIHPIANAQGPCQPLGKSDVFWGAGKSYPYGGEDFSYLIWTKKHCCLDAVKAASATVGTPTP